MATTLAPLRTFAVDFDDDAKDLLLQFTRNDPFAVGLCTAYLSEHPDSILDLAEEFERGFEAALSSLVERVLTMLLSDSPPVLYATCVLLSQCDEPFSEKILDGIWKTMPWDSTYPPSISPVLTTLMRVNFIQQESSGGIVLNEHIKRSVLWKLSDADKQSACVSISNYFAQSKLPDEEKIPKAHHYLKKAGLIKEALQLAIAYSTAFVKEGKHDAARRLIVSELSDTSRFEKELRVFLLHQLSVIDFNLQRFDDAISSMREVIKELSDSDNLAGKLAAQSQLANLYAMRGDFDKASSEFESVLNEHEKHRNVSGIVATFAQLGMIAFEQKNMLTAVERFYIAQSLSAQLSEDEKKICRLNWEYLQNELGDARLQELLSLVKPKADVYIQRVKARA
ncbi:MAG: tetratricopeptide repeat protein [Chloroherpetonaceae bacterium]